MLLFYVSSISFFVSTFIAHLVHVYLEDRIAVLGSFAGLQKSYNSGIAFGINLGSFQTVFIIMAIIAVIYMAIKSAKSTIEIWGYGLIIGGGMSNIVDRLIDGKVTDMIQVGTFPIFNVADSCINIGVALLLYVIVMKKES